MVISFDWGTPMYDQSIYLRDQVLRKPLNMVFYPKDLAKETKCIHLAYIDHCYNMIACLYLKKINKQTLQLKQMAVRPELQKKGYGSILVSEAENTAVLNGYSMIILHARQEATGFYKTLGYETEGDIFFEIGIPHYKMIKNLKKTY